MTPHKQLKSVVCAGLLLAPIAVHCAANSATTHADTTKGISMKNSLAFNIPFAPVEETDFINCFAAVHTFLEGEKDGGADSLAARQERWFYLFDAMSGAACVRRHYGGARSETQTIVGNVNNEFHGNDYITDFVFGFAGYEYRKLTDAGEFKAAIMQSVDAGKPVLAKTATYFHVITGYDGDALLCPDYANAHNKPTRAPQYAELKTLYVFGDTCAPRYTLKDGLERIRRMMELNINEKIWDAYIDKLQEKIILPSDEEFNKLTPAEQKEAMAELTAAAWCEWTICNLGQAFYFRDLDALRNPALDDVCKRIFDLCTQSTETGHAINYLNGKLDWPNMGSSVRSGIGYPLQKLVERYRQIDAELLEAINRAIAIVGETE